MGALTQADTRVLVWHVGASTGRGAVPVSLVSTLRLTRFVHSLHWRHPRDGVPAPPALVVVGVHHVAYVYRPVDGEAPHFRLWAAVDPASDVADVTDSDTQLQVKALLYSDAYRMSVALSHDLAILEHYEQRIATGLVQSTEEAALVRRTRKKQLQQYLAQAPDLVMALMSDGSLVVHALLHMEDARALVPSLLRVRMPPCVAVDEAFTGVALEMIPLSAPHSDSASVLPTAVVHAQTASGLRGSLALSLALLLDGDVRGVLVQDTMAGTAAMASEADSPPTTFLRAEHRSDILSLEMTHMRQHLLSFSQDGLLIWWKLVDADSGAAFVSEHQIRLRHALAACALGDGPHVAALQDGHVHFGLLGHEAFAPAPQEILALNDVTLQRHDIGSVTADDVVAFHSVTAPHGDLLVLCTRRGELRAWDVERRERGWTITTQPPRELDTGRVVAALIVPHLHPSHMPALLTITEHGTLDIWTAPHWERMAHVETGLTRVHTMRVDAASHLAIAAHGAAADAWQVQVRDLSYLGVCDSLVHAWTLTSEHAPSLAWTTIAQLGSILAVSYGRQVELVAQGGRSWSTMAMVQVPELGSGHVSHVKWASQHHLLVASSCQLFLFDTRLELAGRSERQSIEDALAERHRMLPYYHPQLLRRCVQWGLVDHVSAALRAIRTRLEGRPWPAVPWTFRRTPLAEGVLDGLVGEADTLDKDVARLDDLDADARAQLAELVRTIRELGRARQVDACALQFLAQWDGTSAPSLLALLSHSQPMLLAHTARAWEAQRISWPIVRATRVFAWATSRDALVPIMEQVARAAFTVGDDIDPVRCMLFYLALKNMSMVRSVWRRAVGHPDQTKMNTFLRNDMSQERWRVAAQKNAFALLSQRRFDFAAAFFMLGGALADAAGVCVRHLHDVDLALALARVYEDEDRGPVFVDIVKKHLLPHAIEAGDRWQAAYACYVLRDHATLAHVVTAPLGELAEAPRGAPPAHDTPDPAMLLLLEQLKREPWYADAFSLARESQFVAFCARLLQDQGTWRHSPQNATCSASMCWAHGTSSGQTPTRRPRRRRRPSERPRRRPRSAR